MKYVAGDELDKVPNELEEPVEAEAGNQAIIQTDYFQHLAFSLLHQMKNFITKAFQDFKLSITYLNSPWQRTVSVSLCLNGLGFVNFRTSLVDTALTLGRILMF